MKNREGELEKGTVYYFLTGLINLSFGGQATAVISVSVDVEKSKKEQKAEKAVKTEKDKKDSEKESDE